MGILTADLSLLWFAVHLPLYYSASAVFLISIPGTDSGFVGPAVYEILDLSSKKYKTLNTKLGAECGMGPVQMRRT